MKAEQKGFSVVAILIVIVIVALFGSVGWFVHNRQKSKTDIQTTIPPSGQQEDTIQQQNPEVSKETIEEVIVPEGWVKYDSNPDFSFIYPKSWESTVKVTEHPLSEVVTLRYVGDVKLNPQFDGWTQATTYIGAVGDKANVLEERRDNIIVWRLGFGDAGYGSFTPTFVAGGKRYEITTSSFCPEDIADCLTSEEYRELYDKLVSSIRLL